jgi:ATP adenylyltransferase
VTPSVDNVAVSLPQAIRETTRRALATGALQPIETDAHLLDDAGVRFILRTASSLVRKDEARRAPKVADPLGDYDPDLFVADLGPSHYLLLNKFNLLAGHVLIVTRRFEPQEHLLTPADFEALAACLRDIDGLGFYNGGAGAGASQGRKHLQFVPLPLAPESPDAVPMERALDRDGCGGTLPFAHAFARLPAAASGDDMHALYRALLRQAGIAAVPSAGGESHAAPYNLLVRRGWMWVVPRTQPCFETIPLNALGFAGSLFVRSTRDLDRVRTVGPMQVLRAVARGDTGLGDGTIARCP